MATPLDLPGEAIGTLPIEPELAPRPALRVVPDAPIEPVDFDAFVRKQTPRLVRLVRARLSDNAEAEEIAQETMLRAHQHRASFSAENELIAWTTVVAQRLVIDRARVRGRSIAVAEIPEGARVGRDTADVVVARAEARLALESLEAIPERQASVLWAREVEGMRYDEIGERFGMSEPTVRSLLHRARQALRKEYEGRGGELPLRGIIPLAPWLVALRSLGKLRGSAKTTFKSGTAVAGTLSMAGVLALGITVVRPELGGPRHIELPNTRAVPSASSLGTAEGGEPATPHGGGAISSAAGTRAPARTFTALDEAFGPGDCIGATVCSTSNPTNGEWIGVLLPENPTGVDRVGARQNLTPTCTALPSARGVLVCEGSSSNRLVPRIPAGSSQGALR